MSERWRIPNSKPWITDGDRNEVLDFIARLQDRLVSAGDEVRHFERELAEFLGRKYVVCVSSGSMALELAHIADSKDAPNELVECPAFGFVATPNAIERIGNRVEFVDSNYACSILGEQPVSWSDIEVRDACQAFGAKLPPSLADCYSFNWNKPITCLGGGCVATDDGDLAGLVDELRDHGRDMPRGGGAGLAVQLGTNARMSDMQAALGRSQLRRVGEILDRRQDVANWHNACLSDRYDCPVDRDSWFLYPIELSNRDEVHAKMLERGIQTRSCADWLLPAHPYYAEKYGYKRGDFPEAERRADRTLLLPLYPEMTLEQVREVCEALKECDAKA